MNKMNNLDKLISRKLKKARKIRAEDDEGNIEYKWKLCDFKYPKRIIKYTTQMRFRLYEGDGAAIYNLGYSDDGDPIGILYNEMLDSLRNVQTIAESIGATVKKVSIFQGENGYCANIFIDKQNGVRQLMMSQDDLFNSVGV